MKSDSSNNIEQYRTLKKKSVSNFTHFEFMTFELRTLN